MSKSDVDKWEDAETGGRPNCLVSVSEAGR